MQYLKQSTEITVMVGPFVDATDGVTPETALTITQPDIRLSKAGAAFAQKNAAQTLTHGENGWYSVTLDTTDTNTLGRLDLAIYESGALPVWREFSVLTANLYDSLFSTDKIEVDAVQWLGTAIATPDTAGYPKTTIKDGTGVGEIALDSGEPNVRLSTQGKADVNAEVVDVLNVDTFAEPTGVPPASASLTEKLGVLYAALRNKVTVTASKKIFFSDTDTAEWEKDLSDDDTTYTETEANAP